MLRSSVWSGWVSGKTHIFTQLRGFGDAKTCRPVDPSWGNPTVQCVREVKAAGVAARDHPDNIGQATRLVPWVNALRSKAEVEVATAAQPADLLEDRRAILFCAPWIDGALEDDCISVLQHLAHLLRCSKETA